MAIIDVGLVVRVHKPPISSQLNPEPAPLYHGPLLDRIVHKPVERKRFHVRRCPLATTARSCAHM